MKTINTQITAEGHKQFIAKQMDEAMALKSSFQDKVQKIAVMVLYHAMRYKDNSGANAMLDKLVDGKSVRKQGLVNWFSKYGGFEFDLKTQTFKPEFNNDAIKDMMAKAKAEKWYECAKTEVIKAVYDINKEIVTLTNHINKAKQRLKDNPNAQDNLDIDQAKWNNLLVALGINNAMEVLTEVKKEKVA